MARGAGPFRARALSRAKAIRKGKGERLPDPQLPLELPVTVQMLNTETRVCFEAAYDTIDVIENQGHQFKAQKLGSPRGAFIEVTSGVLD
jgi:hypothetical protein